MIRWLPLAWVACLACTETPDTTPDLAVDMRVGDARPPQPAGAVCATQSDCLGVCWTDALGQRCVPACDDGCPAGLICQTRDAVSGCLPDARTADRGEACSIDRPCADGLRCVGDLVAEMTVCAQPCDSDAACTAPERCGPTGVCAPADAPVSRCPFVECARADLLCVDARCVATCADVDTRCGDGGVCTRDAESGAQLCRPDGMGDLGSSCTSGGAASCAPELICLSRAPGDPEAVCSRACADDCPDGFACRRPPGFEAPFCLPAPFGQGEGEGGRFEGCATHGATDCLPELDCVIGLAGRPVCAPPCAAGCAVESECDAAGLTPHCRPVTRDRIGLACTADADCPAGRCVSEAFPFCTAGCAPDCPAGFTCIGAECLPGRADARPLGAECGEGGAVSCADGICAAHPDTGAAVCTRGCADADCPDGFECRALDAQALCFASVD